MIRAVYGAEESINSTVLCAVFSNPCEIHVAADSILSEIMSPVELLLPPNSTCPSALTTPFNISIKMSRTVVSYSGGIISPIVEPSAVCKSGNMYALNLEKILFDTEMIELFQIYANSVLKHGETPGISG